MSKNFNHAYMYYKKFFRSLTLPPKGRNQMINNNKNKITERRRQDGSPSAPSHNAKDM
ncbi:hypothetical protein ABQH03_06535 [Citrobacter freundii]